MHLFLVILFTCPKHRNCFLKLHVVVVVVVVDDDEDDDDNNNNNNNL